MRVRPPPRAQYCVLPIFDSLNLGYTFIMSVEFIDPLQSPGSKLRFRPGTEDRGMVGFLIRRGIVKNEAQGRYVLLGISAIFFAITIYLAWGLIHEAAGPVQSTAQTIERMKAVKESFPRLPQ